MSDIIVKCACQHCQRVTVVPQETVRTLLSEAEQRKKDARAKALEEAAMRVVKLISDMQALEKFNRSYALRMTALAAKDIRALQSEER